jgi:16S rRNA (cytosine967-C5)-methyltransferase
MRASFPSDYASLTQLWSLWLEQDSWPPLDKWLRNHGHLPTQPAHTLRFGQRGNALASTNKYSLNLAMISAMRYLHLACALEFAYRAKTVDVDWAEWDASWTLSAVKKVPPLAFWYWIGLRVNADTPLPSPKALVDAPEREAFFQRMAADRHTATDISDAWFGMWHGLRPQWLALLVERQKASEWNQQQMETFIAQQSYTPPLWLRAQQEKTAEDLREILIAEGVDVHL